MKLREKKSVSSKLITRWGKEVLALSNDWYLNAAKKSAQKTECIGNLKQMGMVTYVDNNNQWLQWCCMPSAGGNYFGPTALAESLNLRGWWSYGWDDSPSRSTMKLFQCPTVT